MHYFIDTHVHARACFPKDKYLDIAAANFANAAQRAGKTPHRGVIMLTESHVEDVFRTLEKVAGEPDDPQLIDGWGGWSAARCEDRAGLRLVKGDTELFLIAGRQIDTSERLEIGVLCTKELIPDYISIDEVLQIAKERDALPVIPWAPGKWMFARGEQLAAMMREMKVPFLLGDNGGRPWLWPTPAPLRTARKSGIRVLQGSDPLPFESEMYRTGTFGVYADLSLDERRPADGLKGALRDPNVEWIDYGGLANPIAFFWKELMMQVTKGKRKRMAAVQDGPGE